MTRFMKFLIQKKMFVSVILIIIVLTGTFSYITIPKQHFPEVVLPVAMVTVVYPGASAEDMEVLVTEKVEDIVMELDGFDTCSSQTYNDVSGVMVCLDMDLKQSEVDDSFDDLKEKMNDLKMELPSGVAQVNVDTDFMDTAGIVLAVTGESVSGDELAQRTEELKDTLKVLNGIKKVNIYGKQESQLRIIVDSDKINQYNLSLADIGNIISAQNSMIPTGDIDVDGSKLIVNTNGKFESIEEIGNIIVAADKETKILTKLSDIAEIKVEIPEDAAKYRYNKSDADIVAAYFNSGINVVGLGDDIRQEIEKFRVSLPDNIYLKEIYFQPDTVNDAVNSFVINLLESILIVIVVVMLGMSVRNGIVVSSAIPIAILVNFIVMKIIGFDIHFVSLAALIIVLGMLVDNAVVVCDSIQVRINNGEDRISAVSNGTKEVALPVFVAMITTLTAFSSLLTLEGSFRQLSISLPVVIITCLIVSYIVSITVIPLMCYLFLNKKAIKQTGPVDKLIDIYDKIFLKVLQNKKKAVCILIAFLIICGSTLQVLDFEIVPKAYKDVVTIEVTGNSETDIHQTEKIVEEIEKILDEQKETQFYLSGVGIGIPRYDYSVLPKASLNNVGDIFVKVNLSKGDRFKETNEIVEFLQNEMDYRIFGGKVHVDELGIMALTSKPVELKLYSDNLDDLNEASNIVANTLSDIPGTTSIYADNEVATYNYFVDMDTKKLNTLGLSKAEVQNELNLALMGRTVSIYRQNGKEYNIVLDSNINSLETLGNYKIKSSSLGQKYSISQFSNVGIHPEISLINRIDGERGVAVGCYTRKGYSNMTIQTELEKKISDVTFPSSVRIEKSGDKSEFSEVLMSVGLAGAICIVVMIVILVLKFASIKKAMVVFISVPFGVMAGITGLFLTGQNITFFGLLGIVSLMGCVLSNAIVLIEFIEQEKSMGISREDACRNAGKKRFRPILMSTMTTVMGLMPLALFGDEIFVPMAILLMFGLLVSMVINLVFVPIAYEVVDRKDEIRAEKRRQKDNK